MIKPISNGYEIIDKTLLCANKESGKSTESVIFKAICDFCRDKKVIPPEWDKTAMGVLLSKYNLLHPDYKYDVISQLTERCKNLPPKVTLQYIIKALGMDDQYREVLAEKACKPVNEYSF